MLKSIKQIESAIAASKVTKSGVKHATNKYKDEYLQWYLSQKK